MSWSEVFTSLQQGTVDGQENSYQTIDSGKVFEVQKYLTQWNYSYDGYFFLANTEAWNKFSDATKALLQEKALEAALWGRKYLEDSEGTLKKKFKDAGMVITELNKDEPSPSSTP
jgi:C4-dicarboxylate transporter DctM subunit